MVRGSLVKKSWFLVVALLALSCVIGWNVNAKSRETSSLKTCEAFGNSKLKNSKSSGFKRLNLIPETVVEEKFEGKAGAQFVSSVLSGRGVMIAASQAEQEVEFTCLLEKQSKAVFFQVKPVTGAGSPVLRCSAGVKTIGEAVPCLRAQLSREENRLSALTVEAAHQAQIVDRQWPDVHAGNALTASTTDWKQYRDRECARREAFRAGGNHPDIALLECQIQKTVQRVQDLETVL